MKCLVYIDGKITTLKDAKISVLDHGFLYGDSVYETFRTFSGYPFQFSDHLDRLMRSAGRIQLTPPLSKKGIKSRVLKTTMAFWKKYRKCDLYIRVIVSRGFGDIGFDPALCPKASLIIIIKKFKPTPKAEYENGVHIALVPTIRNNPKSIDPNIKSGNYLNNILAYYEARKRHASDAIMQNHHGYLTEGTTSNLFLIKRGVLYTPSLSSGLLKGLTRSLILKIAKKHRIPIKEIKINKQRLFSADECFISSSLKGILPVTQCNAKKIGTGKPGPVTQKLMGFFADAIKTSIEEEYCVAL